MFSILKVAWLELQNHLCKKTIWLLTAIYTVFTLSVCVFPDLQQSYFSSIESIPIMLLNFIAPVFLSVILIGMLSSTFAGDIENNVNQIPSTCLAGKEGRSIAKILAAILLSVLTCLIISMITFIVPFFCGVFDSNLSIKYVGDELELALVWQAGQHFVFSFVCLTVASIILSLLILLISCKVKTTIAAVSISTMFLLLEFLFNKFTFPTIIQEYNVWVFFEPYYLFVLEIFNISPYTNLLLLSVAFLPLCIFAVWQIVKNGA